MKTIDMSEYLYELPNLLKDKNDTIIVTNKETCVLVGDNDCNLEFCQSTNLPIYETHQGGTIVNFKGDVCVGNYQDTFNDYGKEFMIKYANWLKTKGLNVLFIGNDVIVDENLKVGSYMSTFINGCLYTAIHLSFGMDLDLIRLICKKKMEKTPTGISEFGITEEELLLFVENNC